MNERLSIYARVDKVHPPTQHVFHNGFWKTRSVILNALDNVAARRYVDSRSVRVATPLIDSGTLGPKGHV